MFKLCHLFRSRSERCPNFSRRYRDFQAIKWSLLTQSWSEKRFRERSSWHLWSKKRGWWWRRIMSLCRYHVRLQSEKKRIYWIIVTLTAYKPFSTIKSMSFRSLTRTRTWTMKRVRLSFKNLILLILLRRLVVHSQSSPSRAVSFVIIRFDLNRNKLKNECEFDNLIILLTKKQSKCLKKRRIVWEYQATTKKTPNVKWLKPSSTTKRRRKKCTSFWRKMMISRSSSPTSTRSLMVPTWRWEVRFQQQIRSCGSRIGMTKKLTKTSESNSELSSPDERNLAPFSLTSTPRGSMH